MGQYSYFFAYGILAEQEVLEAVIGRSAEVVEKGILHEYMLVQQTLADIILPAELKERLHALWGDSFVSLGLRQQVGQSVSGVLYRLRKEDFNELDNWELVNEGWFLQKEVEIVFPESSQTYSATTYILNDQQLTAPVSGAVFAKLLANKAEFIKIAKKLRALE